MKNETRKKIQKQIARKNGRIYTVCLIIGIITANMLPKIGNSMVNLPLFVNVIIACVLTALWIWFTYYVFYRIIMDSYEELDDKIADHTYLMHALHNLIDAHINTCYDKSKIEFGELYSDIFPDIFDMWQNGETFTNSDGEKYTITEWMYDNEYKEWNMTLTKIKED